MVASAKYEKEKRAAGYKKLCVWVTQDQLNLLIALRDDNDNTHSKVMQYILNTIQKELEYAAKYGCNA